MRDLETVSRPEASETSQATKGAIKMDSSDDQLERKREDVSQWLIDHASLPLNLNSKASDDNPGCREDKIKTALLSNQGIESGHDLVKSRGASVDLNAADCISNCNPFYPHKNYKRMVSQDDVSECGSTCGENDSMRLWKEMKKNGFLSSSHAGTALPKPFGRKRKINGIKKNIELAKKAQVDRFAKAAAPSGLLNGLNPGIINHVRNSKQVHSIIEAIVRSEKLDNRKQASQQKLIAKDFNDRKENLEFLGSLEKNGLRLGCVEGSLCTLSGSGQLAVSQAEEFEDSFGVRGSNIEVLDKASFFSRENLRSENEMLKLKLSSSTTMASENTSSLSNVEPDNLSCITSLSVKAASVASQWLRLLRQDIEGRLTALRRSKERVRVVVQKDLPLLMSQELLFDQENSINISKRSAVGCCSTEISDLHRAKWIALFDQMDEALSEEEKHLESSLIQVKEMLLQCERGLLQLASTKGLQQQASLENDSRPQKVDNFKSDLAIRAAAASIYSTCNFLKSVENTTRF